MIFYKTPKHKRKVRLVGSSYVVTIPKSLLLEHMRTTKTNKVPEKAIIEYNDFLEQITVKFDT